MAWMEVLAGEKAFKQTKNWLPDETIEAFRTYLVGIKGPLTTPIGGGIRSASTSRSASCSTSTSASARCATSRACPRPVKHPEKVDMVIFRENTEDIYAGIEFEAGSEAAQKFLATFQERVPQGVQEDSLPRGVRHRHQAGLAGGQRAADPRRDPVRPGAQAQERHLRPQGQHHEVHRGRLPGLGLRAGGARVRGKVYTWEQWEETKAKKGEDAANAEQKAALASGKLLIKDAIADITLQQVLTRPDEFDVIATLNLNGDYLSDALAAQVGGIGIAPGGNINYVTGHAIFEATHGTAPKYADQDKVNPGSVILSGDMMFRHLGWNEAADLIIKGMNGAIGAPHRDLRLRPPDEAARATPT